MFTLKFSESNAELFGVLFEGLIAPVPNALPDPSTWDDYVSAIRKFKQVGKIDPATANGRTKLYIYNEPCVVQLERGEMQLLRDRIKLPIWVPDALERVVEAKKWIEGLADENGIRAV